MARYRPNYRWLIDWDGDGRFAHPFSDVTDHWIRHIYETGARTGSEEIEPATMDGLLTLSNHDSVLDPSSPKGRITVAQLRRKNAFRHLADDIEIRNGLCVYSDAYMDYGGTPIVEFELQSQFHDALTGSELSVWSENDTTVSALARRFSDSTGVLFATESEQPVGIVAFTGTGLDFLADFGRYGGGWAIERMTSEWVFRRFTLTQELPVAAVLDFKYGYIEETLEFGGLDGHIRNAATCRGFKWRREPDEVVLGSTTIEMRPLQRRWVDIRFETLLTHRVVEWTGARVTSDGAAEMRIVSPIRVTGRNSIQVQVATGAYGLPLTREFTIEGVGTADEKVEVEPKQFDIDLLDSVGIFSRRPLDPPEWFPASFAGLTDYTLPWLRNLSQPIEHMRVTIPEWQDTQGMVTTLITAAIPGNVVEIDVDENGRRHRVNLLITSIGHSAVLNEQEPLRTISGIVRRDLAPAPLSARINRLVFNAVEIAVRVPSHAGQPVYSRLRTAGTTGAAPVNPGPWSTVQKEDAHLEEVFFEYLNLERSTAYEAEVSFSTSFSDRVLVTFTTPDEAAVVPNSIKLNGVELDDWTYPFDLEYFTELSLAAHNTPVTLAVTADSDINVSIKPHGKTSGAGGATASIAGYNRQLITWTITCTQGTETTVYTLTVDVLAPVVLDFNDLDSRSAPTAQLTALAADSNTLLAINTQRNRIDAFDTFTAKAVPASRRDIPSAVQRPEDSKLATDGTVLWFSVAGRLQNTLESDRQVDYDQGGPGSRPVYSFENGRWVRRFFVFSSSSFNVSPPSLVAVDAMGERVSSKSHNLSQFMPSDETLADLYRGTSVDIPISVAGLTHANAALYILMLAPGGPRLIRIPDSGAPSHVTTTYRGPGVFISGGNLFVMDGNTARAHDPTTLRQVAASDIIFPALTNPSDVEAVGSSLYRSDSQASIRAYRTNGSADPGRNIVVTRSAASINVTNPGALMGILPSDDSSTETPRMYVVDTDDNTIVSHHFFSKQFIDGTDPFPFVVGDIATNGLLAWIVDSRRRVMLEYVLDTWERTSTPEMTNVLSVAFDGTNVVTTFGTAVKFLNPAGLAVERELKISGPEGASGTRLAVANDILYLLGGGGGSRANQVGALSALTGTRTGTIDKRINGTAAGNVNMNGIWASDRYMFVSDSSDHKIYAYDLDTTLYVTP